MKSFIDFFVTIGKLRKIPRRGGVLIGSKFPATITDHLFRVAMMAWVLGKESKINLNFRKVFMMALAHDLCEFYAGDVTPYDHDSILPKDKKQWPELFDRWPRNTMAGKKRNIADKYKREKKGLERVLGALPTGIKKEIKNCWLEYSLAANKEARFVKQINRLETLLQALEYGREENIHVYKSWWIGSKERIDQPLLIKFMNALEKEFPEKNNRKK